MLDLDKKYFNDKIKFIIGVDEAGRGPLAGPVVAASVLIDETFFHEIINDSKKLSERKRNIAYEYIIQHALNVQITVIDVSTIDKINILEASRKAMKDCVKKINVRYDLILTDYMKFDNQNVQVIDVVKGDQKSLAIAAASIVAKVTRDRIMNELDKVYPEYEFSSNKGYGSKQHLRALELNGYIKGVHRESFGPIKEIANKDLKLF